MKKWTKVDHQRETPDGRGSPFGGGSGKRQVGENATSLSFRDKVIGKKQPPPWARVNLIEKKLAQIEYENENKLKPMLHLDMKVVEELCLPWQDMLVIKQLGKSVVFFFFWLCGIN